MPKSKLKTVLIMGFLGVVAAGCGATQDVAFTRKLMRHLVQGRHAVRASIDWPSLKMLGADVGARYARLPDEQEQEVFQRAFIDSFSKGFRSKGVKVGIFFNWRFYDEENPLYVADDPKKTIVAANCVDETKLFLFVVDHQAGRRKLSEMLAFDLGKGDNVESDAGS